MDIHAAVLMVVKKLKDASNFTKLQDMPDWNWFEAIYLWEYGATTLLAELVLESNDNIPFEIKRLISHIVSGIYSPEKKKAGVKIIQNYRKSRGRPEDSPLTILMERLTVLRTLFDHHSMLNDIKNTLRNEMKMYTKANLNLILKQLEDGEEDEFIKAAKDLSISLRSIKKAYFDFESRANVFVINKWFF